MEIRLLVLRTPDMTKLADFYGLLGLTWTWHQHGQSPFHYSASIGSLVLEIYPLTKTQEAADHHLRVGFSINDFDTVISRLKNEAVSFVMEPAETAFGYMAVVKDPDGRKVELYKQ